MLLVIRQLSYINCKWPDLAFIPICVNASFYWVTQKVTAKLICNEFKFNLVINWKHCESSYFKVIARTRSGAVFMKGLRPKMSIAIVLNIIPNPS